MSDFLNLDPQGTAEKLAYYDIMTMETQLKSQQTLLATQKAALKNLKTALTDFRTAMTNLNKANNGMLQNSATVSNDSYAKLTANSTAAKGNYSFYVEKLASAHQSALTGLSDDDIANGSGTLSLTVDGKQLDIDMDSVSSLEDLAKAINGSDDNPGVTASLVRTNGQVSLMLSGENTGANNKVELNMSGSAFATAQEQMISEASDAVVWIGDKNNGMQVTNDTNTFDELISGVTIEFTQAHRDGDIPLRVNVGTDDAATKEQLQSFVDAYNSLTSSLAELTKSGSGGSGRGAFAGDSGIMALERQLNSLIRTSFEGKNLTDFGITADREGKLSIDSDKLNDMLKSDPQALSAVFNGSTGLLTSIDKSMDSYLSNTNGQIKMRQDTLDRKETQLSDRELLIETRYNTSYTRYLKQFSQLQKVLTQMNSTMSMFTTTSTS